MMELDLDWNEFLKLKNDEIKELKNNNTQLWEMVIEPLRNKITNSKKNSSSKAAAAVKPVVEVRPGPSGLQATQPRPKKSFKELMKQQDDARKKARAPRRKERTERPKRKRRVNADDGATDKQQMADAEERSRKQMRLDQERLTEQSGNYQSDDPGKHLPRDKKKGLIRI